MDARAFLRDFTYDLFISYGRLDDTSLDGSAGWVSQLRLLIQQELAMELGAPVSVFMDEGSARNDNLDDLIKNALHESALFVAVVTPKFCSSQWCKDELTWFLSNARASGTREQDLFKVLGYHVDENAHPAALKGQVGYNFVHWDEKHKLHLQRALRNLDDPKNPATIEFRRLIRDLASRLKNYQPPAPSPVTQRGKCVFLADTVGALRAHRTRLTAELTHDSLEVSPPEPGEEATEGEILRIASPAFENCALSIHLLGAGYGRTPEDSPRSIIELHLRTALTASKAAGFPVVIWIDRNIQVTDNRQQELLKTIRADFVNSPSVKLLDGVGFEELESFVKHILVPAPAPPALPSGTERMVFLQFSESDLSPASAIQEHLFKRGLRIRTPAFRGKPGELRRLHTGWLKECHATIIYYGESPDQWVYQKRDEVRQILRDKLPSKVAAGIYVGPPPDQVKGIVGRQDPDFEVIECPNGFCPEQLDKFIAKIQQAPQ
jgi:hypothetical protein